MKAYYLPNWDGRNAALVAARNLKDAVELLNCSIYTFCGYGGIATTEPLHLLLAFAEPGRVWVRPINDWVAGEPSEWSVRK